MKDTETTDPKRFCARIAQELAKLPDAHLEVRIQGRRCLEANDNALSVGGENCGPKYPRDSPKPWSICSQPGPGVGVLSITHFPPRKDTTWRGFGEAIERLKAHNKVLVIDLRSNTGGDDGRAYDLAHHLAGRFIRREGVTKVVSQRPETIALRINHLRLQMKRTKGPLSALQEGLEQLSRQYTAAKEKQLSQELRLPVTTIFPSSIDVNPFHGPIYVLVNRRCASSCENAVDILRRLPNVTTVGTKTAGAIHFGNVGKLVLPRSRVVVQLASQITQFDSGEFFEKEGYPPDIEITPDSDALHVAVNHAKDQAALDR